MGTFWKSFEMPKRLACDEATLTPTYGKFIAEPFERGFGTTIGNSLKRILISSIEGAAVTNIKIDGAMHEFSTIEGVLEDIPQILLNIKQLILKSHAKEPKKIQINVEKKGEILASDIEKDELIEILNPNLHIATLTKKVKFNMDMEVNKGKGFVPSERNKKEGHPIGVIPLDAVFGPVRKVNFEVENTRVGQMTDYDKLILEIWTNGSMSPKDALLYASNILQHHLDVFVNFGRLPELEEEEEQAKEGKTEEIIEKLKMPVTDLELSVRSSNCLREAKIKTILDLVKKTESEMLKYRNFGKKSLSEIGAILKDMGLELGMKLDKEILKKIKETE